MVKRLIMILLGYIFVAVILIPFIVIVLVGEFSMEGSIPLVEEVETESPKIVEVFSPLEEYVVGVVAAEMPASFPEEALKAQAVTARTYEVREMKKAGSSEVIYDVGQAYNTIEEQKEKWGADYNSYSSKIRKCVKETAGEILVYEGEPILAVFHAQSGGTTETAENIWETPIPYLKSVDSTVDKKAPENKVEKIISQEDVWEKLSKVKNLEGSPETLEFEILERSLAEYILQIQVGGQVMTGREVREALGLRSANFSIEKQGESFHFTTLGYGHGAGMSQYGASFLAEEGMTYKEILEYYYQGISFQILE